MKVKVEKFTISHNGSKFNPGSIFDINKKEAEKLLEKGYISIVEDNEEMIEEEEIEIKEKEVINLDGKVEITEEEAMNPEEEIENSELPKKKKTNKNK